MTINAAAIQFNITLGEIDRNLAKAEAALRRVAAQGAQLAVLPENFALMGRRERDKLAVRNNDMAARLRALQ